MNSGKTIFAQLIEFLPMHQFRKCVNRYQGNHKVQSFSCYDQFLCMAFAQLTNRESLRDIVSCLHAMQGKLYHIGIRGAISRSTLADANNARDWRIYAEFAQTLIRTARKMYSNEDFGVELENTVYALDSTTIDLCLSLFPWAAYCKTQAGVKMHTLLDLRGPIPSFAEITDIKIHDVEILDILIPESGSFYIMDRGYLDFKRLYSMEQASSFFVIRSKKNIKHRRLYSRKVDKTSGLCCDQTVVLTGKYTRKYYPDKIRRIVFWDEKREKRLIVFTNNFFLSAKIIARLYRERWKVELFFKWIKQHLRIKKFFGTSENAVKLQIWIAISVYVLVAIVRKSLKLEASLYTILQVLSISIFEKTPILQAFAKHKRITETGDVSKQLLLFDL